MSDAASERFLVTGALGCIGAWTVRLLLEAGVAVTTLDKGRDAKRLRLVLAPGALADVTMLDGDVADLAALERVLEEQDITHVIHLAALQTPASRADPPLGAMVNVVGTVNVFEAVKRRRARGHRLGPVAYAGSVGMYAPTDADPLDGVLREDAVAHPHTHYGVYKLANEGTARVYWQDDGVASYGLRPMIIYGPGRDQGLTSDPTRAVLAALLGRPFEIAFGGRSLFQYAPDAARAFVTAARAGLDDARVSNLDGVSVSIDEFIASLERVLPGASGLVTHSGRPLPFPERIDSASLADLGPLPVTPLDEAMAATVAVFRGALERGDLVPEEHGLG